MIYLEIYLGDFVLGSNFFMGLLKLIGKLVEILNKITSLFCESLNNERAELLNGFL